MRPGVGTIEAANGGHVAPRAADQGGAGVLKEPVRSVVRAILIAGAAGAAGGAAGYADALVRLDRVVGASMAAELGAGYAQVAPWRRAAHDSRAVVRQEWPVHTCVASTAEAGPKCLLAVGTDDGIETEPCLRGRGSATGFRTN